ncbi:FAD-linked oxidase C-terminal domain-containing protein [Anaeromyxobacter paludicola]|uniref:FAD-binding protein n=1 Tax=Anaeromyxobacter paludicola TaxID=2918171 RepID=A0ABM7XA77_9BACT|nr:FAD-linked oxidase C-terminal domain-containing protein [Anaeromyxobacter paludicola]BDG08728.1 FAD-binding protein [Anaeromyxobacter paludicola]
MGTPARAQAGLGELVARVVGARNCIRDPADLATYACDGLTNARVAPALVALPGTTEEVAEVVRLASAAGVPIVPRGSGTGLSGGARPVPGCLVLGLSRMRRILEVDLENGRMRVQPGVINLEVSSRVGAAGWYYAPDPSSQSVCTIGGNVAENSGGAHCLKYGFTTHHVLGATVVLDGGEVVTLGGPVLDAPGYDLLSALVGSEGMCGVVTEVWLRLLRKPEATRTFLAIFPSTDEAGAAVSGIIAAGILPAAIEMMDRLAIAAAKAATGLDWPDQGALLLMDVDGPAEEAEHTAARAVAIAEAAGALEVRRPRDDAERLLMWKGRKSAFAAVGRISPDYVVEDGVIPRSEIARVLREIAALAAGHGLRVANVFHAGDGNLHPLVLYDARVPGELARAERLGGEILALCVRAGGSITGEHGVGAEKAAYMAVQFREEDLAAMAQVRCAFDPLCRFNPGKVFPTPRLCGDRPGPYHPHPAELAGLAERV